MAEYIDVDQAIGMEGLRVVLSPGVPGPWSEAAKGILHVKRIPYVRVRQEVGGKNLALIRWTAQATAPVFAYNNEPPRSTWIEQLFLAERLGQEPPLIPANLADRTLMFGLANEICGETGFGWSRRLMMLHQTLTNPAAPEAAKKMSSDLGAKYGYTAERGAKAAARVTEILRALGAQLESQRSKASRFFIGDRLTALDIYWASFAALLQPLPDEVCPMAPGFRRMYECTDPAINAATAPELFEHRDYIYREFLQLPIDL
jgi:glutathione S-transferase